MNISSNKSIILWMAALLIILIFAGIGITNKNLQIVEDYNPSFSEDAQVSDNNEGVIHADILMRDAGDLKKRVGDSDYIFAGKVLEQFEDEYIPSINEPESAAYQGKVLETRFKIEVIYNVKGDLEGEILVNQYGGYIDGVPHAVMPDPVRFVPLSEDTLLKPGRTYILNVRPSSRLSGYYSAATNPSIKYLVSENSALSFIQLLELVKNDNRVLELLNAYTNEHSIPRDQNALNRFKDLTPEEQQAVYDKIAELEALQN